MVSMRIVHFSDWHWTWEKLPEADLYICTGDMYDNYPTEIKSSGLIDPYPHPKRYNWGIVAAHEREMQTRAAGLFVSKRGVRELLSSPDAPIVCVRGNHDFVDLAPLFGGCNLRHEVFDNEIISLSIPGSDRLLTVTGHRGIPYIFGTWSDETARPDLTDRVRRMPRADIYLTHYPPTVLDGVGTCRYGLDGMLNELLYREEHTDFSAPRVLHCFGHIHESGGKTHNGGGVLFSNAATTYNVIEGSPEAGWKDVSPA